MGSLMWIPGSRVGGPVEGVSRLSAVLSEECRRHVLDYFEQVDDETVDLATLSEYIASEFDPDRSRYEVKLRLYHVDLPKLAAARVIDFDPRSRTVRYHGHPSLAKPDGRWLVVGEE